MFTVGKQLAVRPILDARAADTHGWSVGASDGDHSIHLDAMEEGLTRLVAALPSSEAESKGTVVHLMCKIILCGFRNLRICKQVLRFLPLRHI